MAYEFELKPMGEERRGGEYRVRGWEEVKFLGRFNCKKYVVSDHYRYEVTVCPNFAVVEGGGIRMMIFKTERIARRLPKRILEILKDAGFQIE